MKINLTKELDRNTLVSHIILHNMSRAFAEQLVEEDSARKLVEESSEKGVIIDVKLTVNGVELDLKAFVDYWQSQVHELITERAKELVKEKFVDLTNLVCDLEERIKPEIDKRLEDWEKEDEHTGL